MARKIALIASSFGACLVAGTVRQAYPDVGYLQPFFAYIGGFMAALAIFLPHPGSPRSKKNFMHISCFRVALAFMTRPAKTSIWPTRAGRSPRCFPITRKDRTDGIAHHSECFAFVVGGRHLGRRSYLQGE
jgi:hypothetical protein